MSKNQYDQDSGSYSEEDWWGSDEDSASQGGSGMASSSNNNNGGGGQQANTSQEYTEEELLREAPINYSKLVLSFDKRVSFNELFDKNGAVRNQGKCVLSMSACDFVLEDFNPADFPDATGASTGGLDHQSAAQQLAQHQAELESRRGGGGKHRAHRHNKNNRPQRRPRRDLAKSISLTKFTTSWDGPLGVALPGVQTLDGEGHYMRSPVVCKTMKRCELSPTQGIDKNLLQRPIPTGVVLFHNRYTGQTAETYKETFCPLKVGLQTVAMMMPVNSPLIMYHNAMVEEKDQITGPSKGFEEQNMYQMPIETYKKFEAITDREMRSKLSFADIVGDFQLEFFVPMETGEPVRQHLEYMATGKGTPWNNFANINSRLSLTELRAHATGQLPKERLDELKKSDIWFSGYVVIEYLHCAQRKIPMNTRK